MALLESHLTHLSINYAIVLRQAFDYVEMVSSLNCETSILYSNIWFPITTMGGNYELHIAQEVRGLSTIETCPKQKQRSRSALTVHNTQLFETVDSNSVASYKSAESRLESILMQELDEQNDEIVQFGNMLFSKTQ